MTFYITTEVVIAKIERAKLTCLLRGTPSQAVYKVEWRVEEDLPGTVSHFELVATQVSSHLRPVTVKREPLTRSTEISLEPGSTISFSINTYYKTEGIKPKTTTMEQLINVPAHQDVIPMVTCEGQQQTSAIFKINEPTIIQDRRKYASEGLQLTSIEYAIEEQPPEDGGNGSNSSGPRTDNFVEFKPPCSPSDDSQSPAQPQSRQIKKLRAGKKHLLRLKTEYSTGECYESDALTFHTHPYTVSEKISCCCGYITTYFSLLLLLLISLFLCGSFGAYMTLLHRHQMCTTDYVLTEDVVLCGRANSLQYETIKVGGDRQDGDTLIGIMQAWSVKEDNLIFYSKLQPPVVVKDNITEPQRFLLQGWMIYTWRGSIIYGYCCVTNHGIMQVTAMMYMFLDDKDAVNYINGQRPTNTILSDSIEIPPGRQLCFRQWGNEKPFTVSHSSYHFIGVDIPGNTSYKTNITVLKTFVNGSDYGQPHHFRFDNATDFHISTGLFSHDEHVVVCRAPLYESEVHKLFENATTAPVPTYKGTENELLAHGVQAESLHLTSCKKPYHWMEILFPAVMTLGALLFLIYLGSCLCTCYCMCKYHRDRLYLPKMCRCRKGYQSLPDGAINS
jgi:hypothetical protein